MLELRALDAGIERQRLRRLELRFGLHDVAAPGNAGGVLVAREL